MLDATSAYNHVQEQLLLPLPHAQVSMRMHHSASSANIIPALVVPEAMTTIIMIIIIVSNRSGHTTPEART